MAKCINTKQLNCVYWPQWRTAAKVLMRAGYSKEDADLVRKEIHLAVTGSECSSKELTHRTLDALLQKFAAISAPSNGARQAELADGACKRARHTIRELQQAMNLTDAYIEVMASRIARRPLTQCDENQLKDIIKALNYHHNRHSSPSNPDSASWTTHQQRDLSNNKKRKTQRP